MVVVRMKEKTPPKFGRYRYDDQPQPHPAGTGELPRNRNAFTKLAAIQDPASGQGGTVPEARGSRVRQLSAVNVTTDILEWELSHGRISDAAYSTGRLAQGIYCKARGPGVSSTWRAGHRVDAWVAKELAIIYAIDTARTIARYTGAIVRELGQKDANILRLVLADGKNYAEIAALNGRSGERGTSYFAQRFRDALETLADRWAARGSDGGNIAAWRAGDEEA